MLIKSSTLNFGGGYRILEGDPEKANVIVEGTRIYPDSQREYPLVLYFPRPEGKTWSQAQPRGRIRSNPYSMWGFTGCTGGLRFVVYSGHQREDIIAALQQQGWLVANYLRSFSLNFSQNKINRIAYFNEPHPDLSLDLGASNWN